MSSLALTRPAPSVRVRKFGGSWWVQRWVEIQGHWVWELVNGYSSWAIAYAVALVEASPDGWPYRLHGYDSHTEECS